MLMWTRPLCKLAGSSRAAANMEGEGRSRIRKLDEAVVNRIAAGEVIQRPANSIKEMIENCIDAGATTVQVTVNSGGLKSILIQDNGCGINPEDLAIVCERFTTSKLRTFEDLSSIATYGFRGEALASITHVAHVTITTRTAESKCAYKACYLDGKLAPPKPGASADPKPCAGNPGTQILVEDLFYNMPTRRRALKSASEEFGKIADVIGKYAVHNAGIGFTLKKQGESVAELRTMPQATVKDNIGIVFGPQVCRELLEVACEEKRLSFKLQGFVSNANYSMKKFIFVLFINHRLVENAGIRKALQSLYAAYLPKHMHPFVYLSIEILACNVDVNVHPTKHEVHFLHEDMIVAAIQKCVEEKLHGCNESRTFYTQARLPGAPGISLEAVRPGGGAKDSESDKSKPSYAYQMVRTDSREQKLDAFVRPKSPALPALGASVLASTSIEEEESCSAQFSTSDTSQSYSQPSSQSGGNMLDASGRGGVQRELGGDEVQVESSSQVATASGHVAKRRRLRKPAPLTSIQELQDKVLSKEHRELTELFKEHKFVGCVDQTRALVQFLTKLYLIDFSRVSQELFYQLIVFDFGNFGVFRLKPPAPSFELAMLALNCKESGWTEADGPKETLAEYVVDFLRGKASILREYFSFEVTDDGDIASLPVLIPSLPPNLDRLPIFLLRMATEINWDNERSCFEGFAKEYAQFCCIRHDPFLRDSEKREKTSSSSGSVDPTPTDQLPDSQSQDQPTGDDGAPLKYQPWRWQIEHLLFPTLRSDFVPPCSMATDGSVLQLADLHDLYKVFERC